MLSPLYLTLDLICWTARRIPAKLRRQALSSLPSLQPSKLLQRDYQQEPSTIVKQGKEKMLFDRVFLAKRPRFVDADEDEEEERDTKRGNHGENDRRTTFGSGYRVGKTVAELDPNDYMSILKLVRVNLSNLKSVLFFISSRLIAKILRSHSETGRKINIRFSNSRLTRHCQMRRRFDERL